MRLFSLSLLPIIPHFSNAITIATTAPTSSASSSTNTSDTPLTYLNPSWNTNILNEYNHGILSNAAWRTAQPYLITSTPPNGIPSYNIDAFRAIRLNMRLYDTPGPGLTSSISVLSYPNRWGQWAKPAVDMRPMPNTFPGWELQNLRVTLEDAYRVLNLAGQAGHSSSLGAVREIRLRKTVGPDPYYGPGQMYYLFFGQLGRVNAVGGMDRVVVKDFQEVVGEGQGVGEGKNATVIGTWRRKE